MGMSDKAAATPRPWRVGVDGDVFAGGHVVALIADADGDQMEAANVLSTNISKAEARANAALIARAVNAHDELVAVLDTLVQRYSCMANQIPCDSDWHRARALLARIKEAENE